MYTFSFCLIILGSHFPYPLTFYLTHHCHYLLSLRGIPRQVKSLNQQSSSKNNRLSNLGCLASHNFQEVPKNVKLWKKNLCESLFTWEKWVIIGGSTTLKKVKNHRSHPTLIVQLKKQDESIGVTYSRSYTQLAIEL